MNKKTCQNILSIKILIPIFCLLSWVPGMRIREIREEKGWTLEMVEEKGFPSWRHLQRIETGKNINIITLLRLSKAIKCDLTEFF